MIELQTSVKQDDTTRIPVHRNRGILTSLISRMSSVRMTRNHEIFYGARVIRKSGFLHCTTEPQNRKV